jgi:hypothetical protein
MGVETFEIRFGFALNEISLSSGLRFRINSNFSRAFLASEASSDAGKLLREELT